MKKALSLIFTVILALCVMTSCGKKGGGNEKTTTTNPGMEYTDIYNDKDNIEKKVFYNDDGSEKSHVEYKHDENGNIISEIGYSADGKIEFKSEYEFKKYGNEYKEVKRVVYNSEDKVEFYQSDYKYEKVKDGDVEHYIMKSYTSYNTDDSVKSKTVFTYDEKNNLTKISTYDKDEKLISENKIGNSSEK